MKDPSPEKKEKLELFRQKPELNSAAPSKTHKDPEMMKHLTGNGIILFLLVASPWC